MKHERILDNIGLPTNVDAERMLLGQILMDGDILPAVAEIVGESDFSLDRHRLIWRALANMHAEGIPIDRVTLYSEMLAAGTAEAAGGLTAIVQLDDGEPRLSHPEQYAVIVAEKSECRQAIVSLDSAMTKILSGEPVKSTLTQLSGLLAGLGSFRQGDGPVRAGDALQAIGLDALVAPAMSKPGAIELPWPSVRELIPALEPTQLMILAARPGLGKTAAGVQIGIHAALQGHTVLMFSLEMAIDEILTRILAERGQVNMHKFACGWQPTTVERASIARASAEVCDLDFYLDPNLNRTASAIARTVRKFVRQHPKTRLVIIDYLQLTGGDSPKSNRNEEISAITRSLKLLAMELGIAILALSQLSRDNEKAGRAPILSDLRDCGTIEQDANIVAFLHQRNGGKDTDNPVCDVDFIVAKQRKGAVRTRTLSFLRNTTTFVDRGKD